MNTAPGPDALSSGDAPPSPERHSRKCSICNHPDREAIDEAFLHWAHGNAIVHDYKLPSLSCLYRHAHAVGLWNQRRRKVLSALDRIIERVDAAKLTGHAILRAIEISCRFSDDGIYKEPPRRIIYEYRRAETEPKSNREAHD
jgi:hypothetical protein